MVDVKSAVRIAIDYLKEFQEFIPARSFRLEETEYDENSGCWLITLSTLDESKPQSGLGELAAALSPDKRIYKILRIDAETGNVKSMKVRTLQPLE
ncbi:MAG: hypothetical protein ABSC37_03845 [Xanthobacteraceae bacterium]